jgi:hypothetical protein
MADKWGAGNVVPYGNTEKDGSGEFMPLVVNAETGNLKVETGSGAAAESPISEFYILAQECTEADTEYTLNLPSDCRGFEFKCRTSYDIRFAFTTGHVASPGNGIGHAVLKSGTSYSSPLLSPAARTIYLASSQAGVVVEFVVWGTEEVLG